MTLIGNGSNGGMAADVGLWFWQRNGLAEEWSEFGPGNGGCFVRYLRRVAFSAAT